MLAYVFWHWKDPGADRTEYEKLLGGFHASLAANAPVGYVGSSTFAVSGMPWAASGEEAYEDWYLVEDSAALDPLESGALDARNLAAHDGVAARVGGGAGGLYKLRVGQEPRGTARFAQWFAKPKGMSYDALWELLRPITGEGSAVWCRKMVLGPALELCLRSREWVRLPSPLEPVSVALRPVWP
ncbi:MAG TPA: hypothetical protein VIE39_06270 [Thermoanaerobaculia bacterium]